MLLPILPKLCNSYAKLREVLHRSTFAVLIVIFVVFDSNKRCTVVSKLSELGFYALIEH